MKAKHNSPVTIAARAKFSAMSNWCVLTHFFVLYLGISCLINLPMLETMNKEGYIIAPVPALL